MIALTSLYSHVVDPTTSALSLNPPVDQESLRRQKLKRKNLSLTPSTQIQTSRPASLLLYKVNGTIERAVRLGRWTWTRTEDEIVASKRCRRRRAGVSGYFSAKREAAITESVPKVLWVPKDLFVFGPQSEKLSRVQLYRMRFIIRLRQRMLLYGTLLSSVLQFELALT